MGQDVQLAGHLTFFEGSLLNCTGFKLSCYVSLMGTAIISPGHMGMANWPNISKECICQVHMPPKIIFFGSSPGIRVWLHRQWTIAATFLKSRGDPAASGVTARPGEGMTQGMAGSHFC